MSDSTGNEKLRRPIIALVLSFLTVGLGHLYSTRHKRGMSFYAAFLVLYCLCASTSVAYSFRGFVLSIVVAGCFCVFLLSDAWRTARKVAIVPLRRYNRWFVYVLIVVANLLLVFAVLREALPLPVRACRIPSESMEPSLRTGDYIVVDRARYRKGDLQRGDIVVVSFLRDPSEQFVKRVIALPGETVETRGEQVLINGTALDDPWGVYRDDLGPAPDVGPLSVPADAYFVMGDNRNNSLDSRHWGCVSAEFISAKPLYIYLARDVRRIGKPIR